MTPTLAALAMLATPLLALISLAGFAVAGVCLGLGLYRLVLLRRL
jgi:hypothetical protein